MKERHLFEAIGDSRVKPEIKAILGVSLISTGDARGHFDAKGRQVMVDETTLIQVFDCCKDAKTIKVKIDHGSGVFSTAGYVENFGLFDNKVTADLYLYDSEPEAPRIFEIAKKNPNHMGISLEFIGEDESTETACLARCSEVLAAALVSDPAANTSLFTANKSIDSLQSTYKNTHNMETPVTPDEEKKEPTIADCMAKLEEIAADYQAFKSKFEDGMDKKECAEGDPKPDPEVPEKESDVVAEKEKELSRVAELAAQAAIKQFTAKIGIVNLPASGVPAKPPAAKTFSQIVEDETKRFEGDKNKAMIHCIKNYPKEYEASRQVSSVSK